VVDAGAASLTPELAPAGDATSTAGVMGATGPIAAGAAWRTTAERAARRGLGRSASAGEFNIATNPMAASDRLHVCVAFIRQA
jgi:hypothetical protein